MSNSLLRPMNKYLIFSNALKIKSTPRLLKQYMKLHGRNSAPVKFYQNGRPKIFSLSTVNISPNAKALCFHKKYSTDSQKQICLMDFPLIFSPNLFKVLKLTFLVYFELTKLDRSFYIGDFLEASKQVMEIITCMLSEARFSDLNDLFTKECKEEVEKNIKALEVSKRMSLAIKADEILDMFPYDIDIIKDEGNKKIFVQILVVYHIHKNLKKFTGPSIFNFSDLSLQNYTIYNTRFIKEFTPGVEDQWTINAINIYKFFE